MANVFQNPSFVDRMSQDAAMILRSEVVATGLFNRDSEQRFVNAETGGTVKVKYTPAQTALMQRHQSAQSALTDADVSQQTVEIDARQYFYVKMHINTVEHTFSLDSLTENYTRPAMVAIAEALDIYGLRMASGAAFLNGRVTGTAGTTFDSVSDIVAGRTQLRKRRVPNYGNVAIIGPDGEAVLIEDNKFINADFGQDGPAALREAALARRYGYDFYVDQNAGENMPYAYSTVSGAEGLKYVADLTTVLSDGIASASDTTVTLDTFPFATGVLHEGACFKVVGDTNAYYVTADTPIVANEAANIPITPAVVTGWADGAAVTFQTAPKMDFLLHPSHMAQVVVAPEPLLGVPSSVVPFEGYSVRVSLQSDFTGSGGAKNYLLYDVYTGARLLRGESIQLIQAVP